MRDLGFELEKYSGEGFRSWLNAVGRGLYLSKGADVQGWGWISENGATGLLMTSGTFTEGEIVFCHASFDSEFADFIDLTQGYFEKFKLGVFLLNVVDSGELSPLYMAGER